MTSIPILLGHYRQLTQNTVKNLLTDPKNCCESENCLVVLEILIYALERNLESYLGQGH